MAYNYSIREMQGQAHLDTDFVNKSVEELWDLFIFLEYSIYEAIIVS